MRVDIPREYLQRRCSNFWVRYVLGGGAGSVLTGIIVKHEQKKKDKSARLLKELESETRAAVNLARHVRIPPTDDQTLDPGKRPRDPGPLGRSVVTPLCSYRTAEPISYRDELFQRFALDYAANEDKIRKLYEELEQETQRLHVNTFIVSTSPTDPGPLLTHRRIWKKSWQPQSSATSGAKRITSKD